MAKIALKANPTFPKKVEIPVAGGASVEVLFTFKHRARQDFADWVAQLEGKDKVQAVMECATDWELDEKFGDDTVRELLDNYLGAGQNIIDTYIDELTKAKAKN